MKILYVDPNSYHNLSRYDSGMLSAQDPQAVTCVGSVKWDCPPPAVPLLKWFTYNDVRNPLLKGLSYVRTMLRIGRYALRHGVGIIHLQWLKFPKFDLAWIRWMQSRGVKIVLTAHNILPHDSGDRYRKVYGEIYRRVDRICVHTASTRQELISGFHIPEQKIEVVPHGILDSDLDSADIASRSAELRRLHGIGEDELVFASMGVQSAYKGVDEIIRVWASTEQLHAGRRVRLLIVGRNNGLDYSPLSKCPNVVIVDEKVSNLDFSAYMELADVVLLPYRAISQSGILFSAIAQDKPVLVNRVGGLADPLAVGDVGWIIGETMGSDLRSAMLALLADRKAVKSYAASRHAEFARVRTHYSWPSISRLLAGVYAGIK